MTTPARLSDERLETWRLKQLVDSTWPEVSSEMFLMARELLARRAEATRPTCATCKEWTGRTNGPMRQVANCKQGVSIGSASDQTPYNFHCAFYEADPAAERPAPKE